MKEKTKDYEMFKKHDSNRDLVPSNLEKIIKSIKLRNLLEFRPILVDADYNVIDGQHRLEAAKMLDVEIWYEVHKKTNVSDMFLLNANQRKWYPEDYLNYYINEGKEDYKKLGIFMKKKSMNLAMALQFIKKYHTSISENQKRTDSFNAGKFQYPEESVIFNIEETYDKIQQVIQYIINKLPGQNYYLTNGKFMIALTDFFNIYPVDFNELMKKLPFKLDLIRPCGKRTQYIEIFKQIYNYRNQNPLYDEA